jgi:DNA replication and repair protein RecF
MDALDIWTEQMIAPGERIYRSRSMYIEKIQPVFRHYQEFVSLGRENVGLTYESQLEG